MNNVNNITLEQIIAALSAIVNPNNHVMDAIPASQQELLQKSALISLSILKTSEMVSNSGGQIDHNELYNILSPLLTDPAVIDSYNRWKDDLYSMTPNMLKRKRIEVILDVLNRDIMKHDDRPINDEFDNVREDYIKPLMACEEELSDDIKKELAKLKRHLIIDGDIIMIDRQSFGKYAMKHIKDFSYEVERNLQYESKQVNKIIFFNNNLFATGHEDKHVKLLPNVLALVTDRQKYTAEWIDKFIDTLMASEHGDGIAEDWKNIRKRDKIPALIAGTLVKAGVFPENKALLARTIRKGYDFHVSTDSYSTYMGMTEEQPYLDWVLDHVKNH